MKRLNVRRLPWEMAPVIMTLAWPTMLEQLLQTAVQYIDTAMVGSLGTQAMAAVGATTTIGWLVGSTISALSIGFLAYISQADGAGDRAKVSRAASQAALATLVCGVFFTLVCLGLSPMVPVWMQVEPAIRDLAAAYFFILYAPMLFRTATIVFGTMLRATGDTRTPMWVGLGVNVINVALNFLLIYPSRQIWVFGWEFTIWGAGQGVIGAALASAIAFTVGGILMTVAVWRHPRITFRGQSLKPDWTVLKPCLKVALPNALQRFGTSLGYVAFASMINALGDVATAAHTIANTVESAFYIPGYGMQTAAATLAGNALGAGDGKKIRKLGQMIVLMEISMMILSGGLLFLFAPQMMGLFSKDALVIGLGAVVLRMVALSEPFYGVSIVIEGMLQGMGKTMMPFVCNIIGMWGIRIVGTYICTTHFDMGLISAWACMIAHNLLLFIMFTSYYRSGKWDTTGGNFDV